MSPGRTVPAPVLARQTGVPAHYLSKVLQQLSAANLIVGRRGLRGGYTLTRPASHIRLTDVVRATRSPSRLDREGCPGPDVPSPMVALETALVSISSLLAKELDRHTIESVLQPAGAEVGGMPER